MTDAFDLVAYLDRIAWRGVRAPSFETLAGVLDAHIRHVPFENFDALLGRPIDLATHALQANHFKSTHPGSVFRQWIFASAVTPPGGSIS